MEHFPSSPLSEEGTRLAEVDGRKILLQKHSSKKQLAGFKWLGEEQRHPYYMHRFPRRTTRQMAIALERRPAGKPNRESGFL
jgi:hypothetical protein